MNKHIQAKTLNDETKKRALQIGTLALLLLLLLLFFSFQGHKGLLNSSSLYGNSRGASGVSDYGEDGINDPSIAGKGNPVASIDGHSVWNDRDQRDGFSVQLHEVDADGINFTVTTETGATPKTFSITSADALISTGDASANANALPSDLLQIGTEDGSLPLATLENGNPIVVASGYGGFPTPLPTFVQDGGTPSPGDGGTPGGDGFPGSGDLPGGGPLPGSSLIPPVFAGGIPTSTDTGTSPNSLPSTTAVPEPETLVLLGTGVAGIIVRSWRTPTRKRCRANLEQR